MKITNKKGSLIKDITSWENAFKEVDDAKHWKEGRSAMSLAQYFSLPNIEQSNGIKLITELVEACGFKEFKPIRAEFEHESRFDKYNGKGRMHDLVIWSDNETQHLVICIEAKVDESFSCLISDAYREAVEYRKNHPQSKRAQRIKELCEKYYKVDVKELSSTTDLRYQLLHYLAGAIVESKSYEDVVFMPIMVFKSKLYNNENTNKEDFDKFVTLTNFELLNSEKGIYKKNINGLDIYATYIEIPI